MTAAVYAARQKAETLLLASDVGGQLNWTLGIENYMGYQFIEGIELIRKFEEQVRKFPIDIKIGRAIASVIRVHDGFEIEDVDGTKYLGRTAIICSGKRPRMLNVPGEEMLRGRGLTYCEVCDGPLFQDMDVAIIGGGNSALEAAIDMTKIARHIYVVSLTPLTGDNILKEKATEAANITVMTEHQTTEVLGDGMVSGIRVKDMKSGARAGAERGRRLCRDRADTQFGFRAGHIDAERARRDIDKLRLRDGCSGALRSRGRHECAGETDRGGSGGRREGRFAGPSIPAKMRLTAAHLPLRRRYSPLLARSVHILLGLSPMTLFRCKRALEKGRPGKP